MIISDTVKIKRIATVDSNYIECELKNKYSDIVRWAVVGTDEDFLYVAVSYNI